MLGSFPRRLAIAAAVLFLVSGVAAAGEVVSTMRSVNAVPEAHGFKVEPAYDVSVVPLPSDHSPGQAFEIIRPDGKPVTIGRLFTSCSCIQLQAHKRTFAPGERAILQLRNVRPTPPAGQIYAIFVQITSPVRTTLRFDTFVQSVQPGAANVAATPQPIVVPTEPAAPAAPATANSDLAAQITRQLEAVEAGLDEEDSAEDEIVAASALDDTDEAVISESAEDETDDAENAEIQSEADDSLETTQEYDFDEGVIEDESEGDEADLGYGVQNNFEDLGTADLAYDLGADLPDFNASVPVAEQDPEPQQAVTAAAAMPVAAVPAQQPVDNAYAQPYTAAPVPPAQIPQRNPRAGKPVQAISLITIGVRDMPASIRFYESLGWRRAARGKYDQTAFFQLQGQILALYPIADLLREQNMVGAMPSPGGITLALNVQDKADVWTIYQRFIDAGGQSLRPPAEMASGAVSSYVADPDGNAWEISWVPHFRIDEDGGIWLP